MLGEVGRVAEESGLRPSPECRKYHYFDIVRHMECQAVPARVRPRRAECTFLRFVMLMRTTVGVGVLR